VSVLLGNGDGTFQAKTDQASGNNPVSVAIADLDGNGKRDLAVADNGSGTVSVLLGNGDGTFQAKTDYATGSNPSSVAVGDLDGDGKRDLAVANFGSGAVSVLLGNGDGTFQAKTDYGTASGPYSVAIADLNGDGKRDLATADANVNEVSVLLADHPPVVTGGGTLSYAENSAAQPVSPALSVSDPDGDMLSGASASISAGYQAGQDKLEWSDNDIGDGIQEDVSSDDQTVVLTGTGTAAEYQAALRAVTYRNTSDNPSTAARTVTFAATDQGGATGSGTASVDVSAADDPPVAVDDNATVSEDSGANTIDVRANDTDVDGGPKTITDTTDGAHGTVAITNSGDDLTYTPQPNYCNSAGGGPDTFTYRLNGGSQATVTVTVTCLTRLSAAPEVVRFGHRLVSTGTTRQVTFTNTGPAPARVTGMTLSGPGAADFAVTRGCAAPLAPGARCVAQVRFRPATAGQRAAQLVIATDGQPVTSTVELAGRGVSRPELTGLRLARRRFQPASSGATTSAGSSSGTNVAWRLDIAATTRFTVLARRGGIRSHGRCVKRRAATGGKPCRRWVAVAAFSVKGKRGANELHFTGRVLGAALPPGGYALNAEPQTAGHVGKAERKRFDITP
jgi:hypothetical protein